MVQTRLDIPVRDQRLVFVGKEMQEHDTQAGSHGIGEGSVILLLVRYHSVVGPHDVEMGIATGGLYREPILGNMYDTARWEPDCGAIIKIEILNSAIFVKLSVKICRAHLSPPKLTPSAAMYTTASSMRSHPASSHLMRRMPKVL